MKNPFKKLSKINPQTADGHRRINNDVMDALIAAKLSGVEWAIVMFIIHKTWGYQKTSDAISTGQIAKATNYKKCTILKNVKLLRNKQIIYYGESSITHYGQKLNAYLFNKHWDTWKLCDRKTVVWRDTSIQPSQKLCDRYQPTKESTKEKENFLKF